MSQASKDDPAARVAAITASIDRLERDTREPAALGDDDPIFLASIGWRSGSTLVQRSLMTDKSVLIWGEPLGHISYIGQLADLLTAITEQWPPDDNWLTHRPDIDLVRDWVANLAPDPGYLKAAHRAFLDNWLAVPARKNGFKRWGVKEVRWTGADGIVLRWLYPKARFLVIVRHPLTSYRSMKNFGLEPPSYGFLDRWPARFVYDAETWGRYWNDRVESWSLVAKRLNASLIRYEDLVEGRLDLRAVGQKLGLRLHPELAAESQVGGPIFDKQVTAEERTRILELTASGRKISGYGE
jgi:hypothetical protein